MTMPKITRGKSFIAIFLLLVAGVCMWQLQYGRQGDRKDLRYQAWKLGLYPMNLDQATSTMVGDVWPDRLVVGKTREELVRKFGYVTNLDQASEYVRYCYFNSPYYGKEILVLRHSNWTVVMNNGRAVQLVLVKGC